VILLSKRYSTLLAINAILIMINNRYTIPPNKNSQEANHPKRGEITNPQRRTIIAYLTMG
jgi:hypothetical protein